MKLHNLLTKAGYQRFITAYCLLTYPLPVGTPTEQYFLKN